MKRYQNLLLIVAVIVLGVFPLWSVQRPAAGQNGEDIAIFGGSDDKAKEMIGEIDPSYQPWFSPIIEPASAEIASMLFALQAALGAGVIGYYLGAAKTKECLRLEEQKHSSLASR